MQLRTLTLAAASATALIAILAVGMAFAQDADPITLVNADRQLVERKKDGR